MPRTLLFSLAVATTLATGFNAHAQKAKPPIPTDAAGRWKWEQMDFILKNLQNIVLILILVLKIMKVLRNKFKSVLIKKN